MRRGLEEVRLRFQLFPTFKTAHTNITCAFLHSPICIINRLRSISLSITLLLVSKRVWIVDILSLVCRKSVISKSTLNRQSIFLTANCSNTNYSNIKFSIFFNFVFYVFFSKCFIRLFKNRTRLLEWV